MLLFKPDYYDRFCCAAGKCPDSCCKEWEVEIDDASARFYRALPGELGDRLRLGFLHGLSGLHLRDLGAQSVPFLGHGGKPGFQFRDLRSLRLKLFQLPVQVLRLGGQRIDLILMLCVEVFQIMNHVLPVEAVERGAEILRCSHGKILPFLPWGQHFLGLYHT